MKVDEHQLPSRQGTGVLGDMLPDRSSKLVNPLQLKCRIEQGCWVRQQRMLGPHESLIGERLLCRPGHDRLIGHPKSNQGVDERFVETRPVRCGSVSVSHEVQCL